jgi:lysozyme
MGQVAMSENKMDKLIETLKRHEGVKSHAYKDQFGTWHIGAGRNIHAEGSNKGMGLSDDEIDYMLSNDIVRTIKELTEEYPWFRTLDEGARRDGIINMHFNLGRYRFAKFVKAIGHMEAENYDEAAAEFLDSRWAKQVKGRSLEVTDMIKTNTYVVILMSFRPLSSK